MAILNIRQLVFGGPPTSPAPPNPLVGPNGSVVIPGGSTGMSPSVAAYLQSLQAPVPPPVTPPIPGGGIIQGGGSGGSIIQITPQPGTYVGPPLAPGTFIPSAQNPQIYIAGSPNLLPPGPVRIFNPPTPNQVQTVANSPSSLNSVVAGANTITNAINAGSKLLLAYQFAQLVANGGPGNLRGTGVSIAQQQQPIILSPFGNPVPVYQMMPLQLQQQLQQQFQVYQQQQNANLLKSLTYQNFQLGPFANQVYGQPLGGGVSPPPAPPIGGIPPP